MEEKLELIYSQVESKRFGMNVYRSFPEELNANLLKKNILKKEVDILILRLKSNTKYNHHQLEKIGFDFIHADSLVYYKTDLSKTKPNKLRNDLEFIKVNKDNVKIFDEIIPIIFNNYQNHYFSNPFLDKKSIEDGYVEWAKTYSNNDENKISWLVYKNDRVAGFATCAYEKEDKTCEGVLYGVIPEFSGQGLYSDIIRFTQDYFKKLDFETMKVSTQIQNYAVQKVWTREGFHIYDSFETYHVNSLINYSCNKVLKFSFKVDENQLSEFASFSGDYNKIHFDSEYAKTLGFSDRIVHGMIILAAISKFIGTEYPGIGSIFISNKNIFLAPIYLNKDYSVEINTLEKNSNGVYYLLFKVYDGKNNICLLSYNKVLNK